MKRYFSRPDILLLILAGIVILLGLIPAREQSLDIHLHDTYYIFTLFSLSIVYAVLLVMEAGFYTVTSKFRQWRRLQIFHIISMALPPLTLIFDSFFEAETTGMPRRYYDYGDFNTFNVYHQALPWLISIVVLIFLAGQIGFIVNIIAGFFRGRKSAFK